MTNQRIPLMDLKLQHKAIQPALNKVIEKIFTECAFIGGEEKDSFEKEFSTMMGTKHCIGVANGTDALFLILKALGIGKGDKVITVANSFIASSETISAAGAMPIFVDASSENYLMDLDLFEKTLEQKAKSENIKAAIVVHLYGQILDMPRLLKIANKHNVLIIEDCAQSHLASIEGKKAGSWGVAGSFSFYPGKNLGAAGDAGAIVCQDDELAKKIKMIANHGRVDKYNHVLEGYNSRLDNLQAGVLRVKMQHLEKWTELRKEKAKVYDELLRALPNVVRPLLPQKEQHVFHLYTVRVKNRDEIVKKMKEQEIEVGVHYPIMLPALKAYDYLGHKKGDFPVAEVLQNEVLSLPLFPEITLEQQQRVVNTLSKFVS